jgi:hypothetical protein
VLADVKHQKAKFDTSDPKVSGKKASSPEDAFDAVLAEPPLSSPDDQPSPRGRIIPPSEHDVD